MSWIVRDPPSPPADNSKLKDKSPKLERNDLASLTPEADLPLQPSSPLSLCLDLVEEQWSTNPLQIKSIFSFVGGGMQSVTSPVFGMGWSLILSPGVPTASRTKKSKKSGKKSVGRIRGDINTVRILTLLQSSPAGFQAETISIRVSFRRGACVFAVLNNVYQQNLVLKGQTTISLGRCDIPLPLYELFIDVDVTVFLQPGPVEEPHKLSASMTQAIRASLDGNFPVDVKFMLFSRRGGGTFACRRCPIYVSGTILKGRNSFLDSYLNGSRSSDNPPSPDVYQYPYDEDSDLESDMDEEPPSDVPRMSDLNAREPSPGPLSRSLSPVDVTNLVTVRCMSPKSPSTKISHTALVLDVDSGCSPFSVSSCEDSPTEGSPTEGFGAPPHSKIPDSIPLPEHISGQSPVGNESTGRDEQYPTDKMPSQEQMSASLPRLVLVNDVAFRTFRALIIYMYTKEVAFISLKSSGARSYSVGDACSPKSMYRLAVKASHEGLKNHAFDNLRSQLTPQNIITEIFSQFTAEYPEIFEMELLILLDHFTNPCVRDEWERMIDTVVFGHLPHGADILKKVTRTLRT